MTLKRRKVLWAIGWLGLAAIFWLSLAPLPEGTLAVPGSDKLAHFLAWAGVSLWFLLLVRQRQQHKLWVLAFVLTDGLIEVVQSFTAYRSGDWLDFAANSSGILAAWWGLPVAMTLPPVVRLFLLPAKPSTRRNR